MRLATTNRLLLNLTTMAGLGALVTAEAAAAVWYANPVTLGTVEMTGGTVSKEIDASALGSGEAADIVGTLKNADKGTTAHDDITIKVKGKGSSSGGGAGVAGPTSPGVTSTTLTKGGESDEVAGNGGSQTQHDSLPGGPLGVNDTMGVWIDLSTVGTYETIVVSFTPSDKDKPTGTGSESNRLDEFALAASRDSVRQGTAICVFDRLAFDVVNDDDHRALVEITGSVTFPVGSDLALTSVYLQDPANAWSAVPANVNVAGNTFSLWGFAPLGLDRHYEIVTVFSASADGDGVAIQLDATFD